ncbi:S-adenosylmethionine decarboxylase family protein [Acinetobacter baumannii]|uniref:S-adenosylmethionine decarboxylase family protein n=1 Tax=Acinetobacter baumannii TaxID=470 RepID=UPI002340495F|nr:S-adenosylmethionine decarboxylase [Acinetobacter baumannii]
MHDTSHLDSLNGLHILLEAYNCTEQIDKLYNAEELIAFLTDICFSAGLNVVTTAVHQFYDNNNAAGVTGVVVLAESHLAFHSWPEIDAFTADVYVCNFNSNNDAKAKYVIDSILNLFSPTSKNIKYIVRGRLNRAVND